MGDALAFDGDLLHGVLPPAMPAAPAAGGGDAVAEAAAAVAQAAQVALRDRRVTLMVAFYGQGLSQPGSEEDVGAGPLRDAPLASRRKRRRAGAVDAPSWCEELAAVAEEAAAPAARFCGAEEVRPAWEAVGGGAAAAAAADAEPAPCLRFFLRAEDDLERLYGRGSAVGASE